MKISNKLASICCGTLLASSSYALSVMTLNLANYNDHIHWDKRLQLIVDTIQKAHADIILLQETRFDPDHESSSKSYQDMAEQIMYELNLRGDFLKAMLVTQPVMYYPVAVNGKLGAHFYPYPASLSDTQKTYYWEGLSIISKLPILETGSIFLKSGLEHCPDESRRITQYIKVHDKGEDLYLANIHFSGNACFKSNIEETVNYLKPHFNTDNIIVAGDFNAQPDNPDFKQFTANGMVDIWSKLRSDENGYTSTPDNPHQRIDYVWANAKLIKAFTNAMQIKVVGDEAQDGIFPSDHLGLVVNFNEDGK